MYRTDDSGLRALGTTRQWVQFALMALAATALAHVLDESAWRALRDPKIYDKDLGRMLRLVGYLPTWLVVAIPLWLHDRRDAGTNAGGQGEAHGWGWRGGLILLAPALGGAAAELLKLVVRRLRPDPDTFGYIFRSFSDAPWSTRGLGMPSSHTMVAFAAAAAMSRVFPRAWLLWYLLATGCAVTRVLALGHFLSDTVAAAFLGYVIGVLLSRSGGFGRRLTADSTAS